MRDRRVNLSKRSRRGDGLPLAPTVAGTATSCGYNQASRLYVGAPEHPTARVTLDQSVAWRLYTKGITGSEAERHARIHGDDHLGKIAMRMVSVIG